MKQQKRNSQKLCRATPYGSCGRRRRVNSRMAAKGRLGSELGVSELGIQGSGFGEREAGGCVSPPPNNLQ
ncbi:hypothetical protein NDU88_000620 [Pleurodeles waltl]|uniref:Uncharacterized protein n=1 Tax=Pleurodeles waltl TaxID=8319 RepID=A0AAV7U5X9_PLEWA|nr:hypothetical protein NDU88_000620 [Pleurodeles waltl]